MELCATEGSETLGLLTGAWELQMTREPSGRQFGHNAATTKSKVGGARTLKVILQLKGPVSEICVCNEGEGTHHAQAEGKADDDAKIAEDTRERVRVPGTHVHAPYPYPCG